MPTTFLKRIIMVKRKKLQMGIMTMDFSMTYWKVLRRTWPKNILNDVWGIDEL